MGDLVSIELPRARAMGLLDHGDLARPHSVLLSDGVRFRVYITRKPGG